MTGDAPRFGCLWEMRPYFRQVAGQLVLGSIAGMMLTTLMAYELLPPGTTAGSGWAVANMQATSIAAKAPTASAK